MKKLYSIHIYLFIAVFPIIILGWIYAFNVGEKFDVKVLGPDFLVACLILLCILFTTRHKRVYLKDSSLYIFNLFSEKFVVVTNQNLVSISRIIYLDRNNYKIKFIDAKGGVKTIYFLKDFFISDIIGAIGKLK